MCFWCVQSLTLRYRPDGRVDWRLMSLALPASCRPQPGQGSVAGPFTFDLEVRCCADPPADAGQLNSSRMYVCQVPRQGAAKLTFLTRPRLLNLGALPA